MIYKCQKVTIEKMPVVSSGIIPSLCDSCVTRDCDNPIRPVTISIMGINKEVRAYISNNNPHFVYECEGFIQKGQRKKDVIQSIFEVKKENKEGEQGNDTGS